jgi:hypothetical protein
VTPDLAFVAQPFHLDIKGLDPFFRLDRLIGVGNDLMDRRLLDLYERCAGVGERVILF